MLVSRIWIVVNSLVLLLVACATSGDASPGPAGQPTGIWREQIHWVPMHDAFGTEHLL
jgi:hypothetical protein